MHFVALLGIGRTKEVIGRQTYCNCRMEQQCPFPYDLIQRELKCYPSNYIRTSTTNAKIFHLLCFMWIFLLIEILTVLILTITHVPLWFCLNPISLKKVMERTVKELIQLLKSKAIPIMIVTLLRSVVLPTISLLCGCTYCRHFEFVELILTYRKKLRLFSLKTLMMKYVQSYFFGC